MYTLRHDDLDLLVLLPPSGVFPGGSVVKNLPANAGDTELIPVLGRSRNSLVAQLVKNPPAMQET